MTDSGSIRRQLGLKKHRLDECVTNSLEAVKNELWSDDIDHALHKLRVLLEKLKNYLGQYRHLREALWFIAKNDKKEADRLEDECDEEHETFCKAEDTVAELTVAIETLKDRDRTVPKTHSKGRNVKLPELKLLRFEGDITKWNEFWSIFDASINSNSTLSMWKRWHIYSGNSVEKLARWCQVFL